MQDGAGVGLRKIQSTCHACSNLRFPASTPSPIPQRFRPKSGSQIATVFSCISTRFWPKSRMV